jgi:hypothetical protein
VQHEAVAVFTGQRVNDLLVTVGTERGNCQRLGFATGKQGGTVGARQNAGTHGDRTHGTGVATIDTRRTTQNSTTHDGGFDFVEQVADSVFVGSTFGAGTAQRQLRRGWP